MRAFFTVILVISTIAAFAFGWGVTIHRMIARIAIDRLSGASSAYFGPIENEMVLYSAYLDEHRTEPNAHFMEIDCYGRYPFSDLPRDLNAAIAKYGESIVMAHGLIWTTDHLWPDSSGKAELYSSNGDLESVLSH